MQLFIDRRVEHVLRHIRNRDAARIFVLIANLEKVGLEIFQTRFPVQFVSSSEDQKRFVIRATDTLRIIGKYSRPDSTIFIEDVVSKDVLEKYFSGN
jgi:hypothetical protein